MHLCAYIMSACMCVWVYSVRPPKKSWKNISNLSGGEKTLSSLALVFALHHYKPTPLYVMDRRGTRLQKRLNRCQLHQGSLVLCGWRRCVVVSALALINLVNQHWAWLVLGWVTVCERVNQVTQVNSAFHPSGVGKSSTGLSAWIKVGCVHLCQVTGITV